MDDEIEVTKSWGGLFWGGSSSSDIAATITKERKVENGKEYTLVISGLTGYSGTLTITIIADAVKDLAGNGNDKTTITDDGLSFNWSVSASSAHFIKKNVTINTSLKEMYIDILANKKNTTWSGFWSSFKFTTDTIVGLTIDGENVKGKLTMSVGQLDYNDPSSGSSSGNSWRKWLVG